MTPRLLCLLTFACLGTSFVFGQVNVRFDQPRYDISPQETFSAKILIDPVPASGLSSFGVKLSFDPGNAAVAGLASVSVPAELDFNGVAGDGAVKVTGPGFAATKGTINFFSPGLQPYAGPLLATFAVSDLAPGPYTLRLTF